MSETINGLKVEVVDYDPQKAEINLKENDWSDKEVNMKEEE